MVLSRSACLRQRANVADGRCQAARTPGITSRGLRGWIPLLEITPLSTVRRESRTREETVYPSPLLRLGFRLSSRARNPRRKPRKRVASCPAQYHDRSRELATPPPTRCVLRGYLGPYPGEGWSGPDTLTGGTSVSRLSWTPPSFPQKGGIGRPVAMRRPQCWASSVALGLCGRPGPLTPCSSGYHYWTDNAPPRQALALPGAKAMKDLRPRRTSVRPGAASFARIDSAKNSLLRNSPPFAGSESRSEKPGNITGPRSGQIFLPYPATTTQSFRWDNKTLHRRRRRKRKE